MGLVTMGVPAEIVLGLARLNNSRVFVETGTFHGGTTRWAAHFFETVHTIERAENLYAQHCEELSQIPGVIPHLGDSREVLPGILAALGEQTAVYWLDGHWSGLDTAGEGDECPVLGELACLSQRPRDIILIDDARFFLCAPPLPHNAEQWPTIANIVEALPDGDDRRFVQVVDDVIFIIPDEAELKAHLVAYAQRRAKDFWDIFAKIQRGD